MADQALIPVDERTVDFYGDNVTAVRIVDGPSPGVYVPLKPISDNIGLDWSAQYRRIQRDPILSQVSQLIAVTAIKSQRGNPEAIALPLKFLPGWLFGINASRVRDELKEKVLRYQLECYDVLWEAFQDGRLTADPAFEELLASNSPAVQTYKMLRDMARLARNQILLEARIEGYESRLEALEAELGNPDRVITPAQAARISQAVKAIAMKISEKSKRNEYGGVYGELYRRFEIPGYRELPAAKFDQAMNWLIQWWQQVAGTDDVPF